MRFVIALATLALVSSLEALDARESPTQYPVQGVTADMKVGVEYMVRSFLADNQSFTIDDYLIVEVGVFPQHEAKLDLRRFTLRINGNAVLLTQTPGMVAASVKYPDWTMRPSVQAGATTADGRGVIIGRDPRVGRWPGDPRQSPEPQNRTPEVTPDKQPIDYERLITRSALPEGRFNKPLAGFLYFPYDGKLKSIKRVELLIDDNVLKLR
ncbi:MAG TPA: hypothetical protein VEX68_20595 [Bryobacteraceae bacterium]|nr:hypothetical protein [Bryobacteraceae bacterium]